MRQVSLVEPGAYGFSCASQGAPEIGVIVYWLALVGYIGKQSYQAFHVGTGDSNSGPHVCVASTLLTKPFPQLCGWLFKNDIIFNFLKSLHMYTMCPGHIHPQLLPSSFPSPIIPSIPLLTLLFYFMS